MTKIEAFEADLIKNGPLTEEQYAAYEKLLHRVRGNYNKLQHCYLTAGSFPPKRAEEAVALIRWGLARYPDAWYSTFRSYSSIGEIYKRCGNWSAALEAYQSAERALPEEQRSYRQALAGDLLWMQLHVDRFSYSEQMERYYDMDRQADDFLRAFLNVAFRLAVAEIVLSLHRGDAESAALSYRQALALSRPGVISRVQQVLDRHRATDRLTALTPECSAFLRTVRKQLSAV